MKHFRWFICIHDQGTNTSDRLYFCNFITTLCPCLKQHIIPPTKNAQNCASLIHHRLIQWQWDIFTWPYTTPVPCVCNYRSGCFQQPTSVFIHGLPLHQTSWDKKGLNMSALNAASFNIMFQMTEWHSANLSGLYTGECWKSLGDVLHRRRQRQETAVAKGGDMCLYPLCIRSHMETENRSPLTSAISRQRLSLHVRRSLESLKVSDRSVHCVLPTCIHMLTSAYSNMTWDLLEVGFAPMTLKSSNLL